ncbi:DUF2218 domain-containing protein [Sphingosinicellaceae bacterium]|nr:DUF2218 domain-containing protein [Sphingosinicellaceae bacterium]
MQATPQAVANVPTATATANVATATATANVATATATANVATTNASRYLQQLCKHWNHKFETEFDAAAGRIEFGAAALTLGAAPDALTLTLSAPAAGDVARMESVVADHLKRFAFREELAVDWQPA